ncbi:MAG: flagellar hook-basal body complex protein [Planctomycetes bacterium]|nr:flagellar hook-basal body complex protein [Planctomycetota bacterium]
MALIGSLKPALTGLNVQQRRVEVVGNNIANLDTPAFKAARVEFNTILSQVSSFGAAPEGTFGGIDPQQVGQGVQTGGISRDFSQGPLKVTGIPSDLAVVGEGFFVAKNREGRQIYTRDGSFSVNPAGLLYDPATGAVVQGWLADENFNVSAGGPLADVEIPVGVMTIARSTSKASLQGNLNSAGAVASSGTWIFSNDLFDASSTNSDLISTENPLGLNRATSSTLLQDLVRSLGDETSYTSSSAGTAGSSAYVFPELQNNPTGLEIDVTADKGDRVLSTRTFTVGGSMPDGGTTLGDFLQFLQNAFGITDGTFDGAEQIEHTYSYIRTHAVTGEEISGTISSSDTVSLSSITISGGDLRGVRAGDFIRFTGGAASGQIAEISSVTDSDSDGLLDTLTLRSDGFNTLTAVPDVGDTYAIHAPAGVRMAPDQDLVTISGATPSSVSTTGGISSFTVTDSSVTSFASEHGVRVNNLVQYVSGSSTVQGWITDVSGNTITVSFNSSLSQDPDAGSDFTVVDLAEGTLEIGGNAGAANHLSEIEISAEGELINLLPAGALADGLGESVNTTMTVYDSLGTPRQVVLTFVYEGSSANGPNIFRYFAESDDDIDRDRIVGGGTMVFDSNGQFVSTGNPAEVVSIDLEPVSSQSGGVSTPFTFKLDFSRLTQFAADFSEVQLRDQDGFRSGTLREFELADDGTITGIFDNGLTRSIGQLALARFPNNNGLIDVGDNYFSTSPSSGDALIGVPISLGFGAIRGGTLEESNVDLAEEFTQLIIGQRAFQANSRTITVSDQMLQELVNLI